MINHVWTYPGNLRVGKEERSTQVSREEIASCHYASSIFLFPSAASLNDLHVSGQENKSINMEEKKTQKTS